ncbi:MAG: Anthranilate phosphoribosyltransferase [Gemmatimonadaceae bacterium]|nr:Anthranilate phosphoribosyltransferase [Gemmatimonadaceae bacterium]
MSGNAVAAAIRELAFGTSLTQDAAAEAFDVIMRGDATPVQVAALLTALRVKGETSEEVAGAARALRGAMLQVPALSPEDLVDTCGTGGGSVTTFNVSTAAAILAAALGVRVAKHGNRSFTSQSGSADVLEALGIPLDAPVERLASILDSCGIVFMFAPAMHPAMRHVGPVRRELGIPTVMNIVGPLANPASAGRQVVGVADPSRLSLVAGALAALGSKHALVVHGQPGMDEVSPLGTTSVAEIHRGTVRHWTIDPEDFSLGGGAVDELRGGTPTENAALIRDLLAGAGSPAARSAVILNTAAALFVAERYPSFAACVSEARTALGSGVGREMLIRMISAYRG